MRAFKAIVILAISTLILSVTCLLPSAHALEPATKRVYFKSPANNAEVRNPVAVEMGVEGFLVKPAGEIVEGTGHHHIIIDGQPEPLGMIVPADATHIHFGKGQTSAELTLSEGNHTLTLQFADGLHRSYGPELSQTISVTVKK